MPSLSLVYCAEQLRRLLSELFAPGFPENLKAPYRVRAGHLSDSLADLAGRYGVDTAPLRALLTTWDAATLPGALEVVSRLEQWARGEESQRELAAGKRKEYLVSLLQRPCRDKDELTRWAEECLAFLAEKVRAGGAAPSTRFDLDAHKIFTGAWDRLWLLGLTDLANRLGAPDRELPGRSCAEVHEALEAIRGALTTDTPAEMPLAAAPAPVQPPDGPDNGRWLWWNGKRTAVPKGTVYRLLAFMWDRDSASYDSLETAKVFDSAVAPQTVRSYANKANNALPPGFPWRLSADSVSRQLTKVPMRHDDSA